MIGHVRCVTSGLAYIIACCEVISFVKYITCNVMFEIQKLSALTFT